MLSFQRLDVYQCAIEFLAISIDLSTRLPKGYAALADQLGTLLETISEPEYVRALDLLARVVAMLTKIGT